MEGNISIFRPIGNECDYIEIELVDKSSFIHFLRARVKYADFAKALTGQRELPCEFELRGSELVGMRREHKTEKVFVPSGGYATIRQRATAAVEALEVDGWKGYVSDALNHNKLLECSKNGDWMSVSYVRHINQDGEPIT